MAFKVIVGGVVITAAVLYMLYEKFKTNPQQNCRERQSKSSENGSSGSKHRRDNYNTECPICLEGCNAMSEYILEPCHHVMHWTCVIELANKNGNRLTVCPVCRGRIQLED